MVDVLCVVVIVLVFEVVGLFVVIEKEGILLVVVEIALMADVIILFVVVKILSFVASVVGTT